MRDDSCDEPKTPNSKEVTTVLTGSENMPTRYRYAAWGQCPDCLDCFTIEFDVLSPLGAPDVEDILAGSADGRVSGRRIGWALRSGAYRLWIRSRAVRVCDEGQGWSIFHRTCTKPFRILSVQQRVSLPPRESVFDDVGEDGRARFGGDGRPGSFWR